MKFRERQFRDRSAAGEQLAAKLSAYANRADVVVLGLPRGGVPVAYEVARALTVPLDILIVRKLGVPGEEELAMGAIASGGVRVLNRDVVRMLGLSEAAIDAVAAREQRELTRREHLYRGERPLPELRGCTVLLVDDGIATGATMRAAIAAVRQQQPAHIVVAVPVAGSSTCAALRAEGNEVVCVQEPEALYAIGLWYKRFPQTTDGEIRDLLDRAWHTPAVAQQPEPEAHP
ncbi:MAG: phosphoribosyltransferase [Ktedonobacterales bacterium]